MSLHKLPIHILFESDSLENLDEGDIGRAYNKEFSRHSQDPALRQQGRNYLTKQIKDVRRNVVRKGANSTFGYHHSKPPGRPEYGKGQRRALGKTAARNAMDTSRKEKYPLHDRIIGGDKDNPRKSERHPANIKQKADKERSKRIKSKAFKNKPNEGYW